MFPLNLYARVRLLHAHIAHETAGAAHTRLSLRPLFFRGREDSGTARAIRAARTRTHVGQPHCLRQTQSVCARERSDEASIYPLCRAANSRSRSGTEFAEAPPTPDPSPSRASAHGRRGEEALTPSSSLSIRAAARPLRASRISASCRSPSSETRRRIRRSAESCYARSGPGKNRGLPLRSASRRFGCGPRRTAPRHSAGRRRRKSARPGSSGWRYRNSSISRG